MEGNKTAPRFSVTNTGRIEDTYIGRPRWIYITTGLKEVQRKLQRVPAILSTTAAT